MRRLAKFEELPDGDVRIYLFAGANNGGPSTDRIKGIHFSVHMSPDIKQGNLIKTTLKSAKSKEIKGYAFTSSIKGSEGFWNIAACRYPALRDPYFDLQTSENIFNLPFDYDESKMVLTLGFAVGGIDQVVEGSNEGADIHVFNTKHFKLVLFVAVSPGPAIEYAKLFAPWTMNPESPPEGMSAEHALDLMRGVPMKECIDRFLMSAHLLYADYLNRIRKIGEGGSSSQQQDMSKAFQQVAYYFMTSFHDRFRDSQDVWINSLRPKVTYTNMVFRSIRIIDAKTGAVIFDQS